MFQNSINKAMSYVYSSKYMAKSFADKAKSHVNGDKKAQGILERDYAYFQETTKDPVAEPKDAKSPFFVKTGTATYTTEFHYKTMAYVDQLMQLKRWRRVTVFRDLYDYME